MSPTSAAPEPSGSCASRLTCRAERLERRVERAEARLASARERGRGVARRRARLIGRRSRFLRVRARAAALERPAASVHVFFATNRAVGPDGMLRTDDADGLRYGVATVDVPAGHPVGALERRLVVGAIELLDAERFHARLRDATGGTRPVLTYVHGYNNSFEYATRRAGQVTHDLSLDAVPVLFAWPTQGGTWFGPAKYTYDENAAARSSPAFAQLLSELLEHHSAPVSVFAHSMGSRVVSEALADLDRAYGFPRGLDQLVLAAPDIDARVFALRYLGVARGVSRRLTVYCADDDRALKVSRGVHGGYDRLGSCSDGALRALHASEVDVIDTSMVYVDFIEHDKVVSSPRLLLDLRHALRGVPAAGTSRALEPLHGHWRLPP